MAIENIPAMLSGLATTVIGYAGKKQIERIDKLEDAIGKLQTRDEAHQAREELSHAITGNFKILDEKLTQVLLHMAQR